MPEWSETWSEGEGNGVSRGRDGSDSPYRGVRGRGRPPSSGRGVFDNDRDGPLDLNGLAILVGPAGGEREDVGAGGLELGDQLDGEAVAGRQ
jgi:hypothetical protein